MSSFVNRLKSSRRNVADEYAEVNNRPFVKNMIQTAVMLIDIVIMFMLIWNMFTYFIPFGSWFNIVDGNSMYPTMEDGQLVFTDMGDIHRGDIVTTYASDYAVQQNPKYASILLVKRVVGVPGDRLIIEPDGVYINGELYEEAYLTDSAKSFTYQEDGCNSVLLDDGEYFVMGDNREASFDSRSFGIVNDTNILYRQSETPTSNFWLKLIFVIVVFALDVFLYFLVEFILTEITYAVLFGRNKKNKRVIDSNDAAINITSETVILKGDKK